MVVVAQSDPKSCDINTSKTHFLQPNHLHSPYKHIIQCSYIHIWVNIKRIFVIPEEFGWRWVIFEDLCVYVVTRVDWPKSLNEKKRSGYNNWNVS